jgi:hypothetical protein
VDEAIWREALLFFEGTPEPGEWVDPEMVAAVKEAFRNQTGPKVAGALDTDHPFVLKQKEIAR